jgi:hypothetical protein
MARRHQDTCLHSDLLQRNSHALLIQPHKDIRSTLLPDEKRDKSASGTAFRKNSAFSSKWEWEYNEKSATFWLGELTMQKWKEED